MDILSLSDSSTFSIKYEARPEVMMAVGVNREGQVSIGAVDNCQPTGQSSLQLPARNVCQTCYAYIHVQWLLWPDTSPHLCIKSVHKVAFPMPDTEQGLQGCY